MPKIYNSTKKIIKKKIRKTKKQVNTLASLAKAVSLIQGSLNVEKKVRTLSTGSPAFIAQQNATADAYYANTLSVSPDQGAGGSQRTGNSIKYVSAMFQAQFVQQTSTISPLRYRWMIVNRLDNTVDMTPANVCLNMFDINPFSGFRDYFANRDPEYFSQFKIVAKGQGMLKPDTVAGVKQTQYIKQPLKLNLHQKYDNNTSVTTTKNKLYLIVQCDGGDTSINTGMSMEWTLKMWYVDN